MADATAARALEAVRAIAPRLERPAVSAGDDDALLRSIVEATVTLFRAHAASRSRSTTRRPSGSCSGSRRASQGDGVLGLSIATDQGLAGYVFSTGQAIAISDVEERCALRSGICGADRLRADVHRGGAAGGRGVHDRRAPGARQAGRTVQACVTSSSRRSSRARRRSRSAPAASSANGDAPGRGGRRRPTADGGAASDRRRDARATSMRSSQRCRGACRGDRSAPVGPRGRVARLRRADPAQLGARVGPVGRTRAAGAGAGTATPRSRRRPGARPRTRRGRPAVDLDLPAWSEPFVGERRPAWTASALPGVDRDWALGGAPREPA